VLAHRPQLGQAEFQADDEHQEHHAELGQVAQAGRILRQRQRVRADHHTHHQIPQHGRQPEHAAAHHAQHGGQQIEQRDVQ